MQDLYVKGWYRGSPEGTIGRRAAAPYAFRPSWIKEGTIKDALTNVEPTAG